MKGSITDKTIVFKCPDCGRTMIGSTITNLTKVKYKYKHGITVHDFTYICNDCIDRRAEIKKYNNNLHMEVSK